MDIFATAYKRLTRLPIKPEKLKVKALVKEPATNQLTEDVDHLEDHDQYSVDARQHQQDQKCTNKIAVSVSDEDPARAADDDENDPPDNKPDHQIDFFI